MTPPDKATPASAVTVDELEHQIERGQLFQHTVLGRHAERLNEIEAFLYGLADVLLKRGGIQAEEVQAAAAAIGAELATQQDVSVSGVALRVDEGAPAPQEVNCAERLPICKAVCCRLDFALSQEEVEAGRVRWDLGRPYFIRHGRDGYCHHSEEGGRGCGVYADRPQVCRNYSCAGDGRIWADFAAMKLNHEWIDAHLGPSRPKLLRTLMQRRDPAPR